MGCAVGWEWAVAVPPQQNLSFARNRGKRGGTRGARPLSAGAVLLYQPLSAAPAALYMYINRSAAAAAAAAAAARVY